MSAESGPSLRRMCQEILMVANSAARGGQVPELGSTESRIIAEAGATLVSMGPEDGLEEGDQDSGGSGK